MNWTFCLRLYVYVWQRGLKWYGYFTIPEVNTAKGKDATMFWNKFCCCCYCFCTCQFKRWFIIRSVQCVVFLLFCLLNNLLVKVGVKVVVCWSNWFIFAVLRAKGNMPVCSLGETIFAWKSYWLMQLQWLALISFSSCKYRLLHMFALILVIRPIFGFCSDVAKIHYLPLNLAVSY